MNKTEVFINKVRLKRNTRQINKDGSLRYSYYKTIYLRADTKVIITCAFHGDFEQTPSAHLQGAGCMSCKLKNDTNVKNKEYFISKANIIHNEKYSYSKTDYKKAIEKVIITCAFHGDFEQRPNKHLQGHGCPNCGNLLKGWSRTDFKKRCIKNNKGLGILYVIRCFNDTESFYKVGITSNDIKTRYINSPLPYDYEVIHEVHREPEAVYNMENKLLKSLSEYSYQPLIPFTGQTECFNDIEALYKIFKDKLAA